VETLRVPRRGGVVSRRPGPGTNDKPDGYMKVRGGTTFSKFGDAGGPGREDSGLDYERINGAFGWGRVLSGNVAGEII